MKDEKRILALILEKDETVVASIDNTLQGRSYSVTVLSKKEEALNLLKERAFQLAIVGNTEDSASVFQIMREIVTVSPMTSMILVTDLSEKEVEEKAEGYGILGHIGRAVPSGDLVQLLDRLEEILGSF